MGLFEELAVLLQGQIGIETSLSGEGGVQRLGLVRPGTGDGFGLDAARFPSTLEPALDMVGTETPKTSATRPRGMPRSTAESTLSLRSFEYGFIPTSLAEDQSSSKAL